MRHPAPSHAAEGAGAGTSDAAVGVPLGIRWILQAGILTTVASILLCLIRMLRGPELADRVLAGDVIALQVVALVVLLTIVLGSPVFYDVALVVAVLGFASTVAFANYIALSSRDDECDQSSQTTDTPTPAGEPTP